MYGQQIACLVIPLAIVIVVSGPVALIISIVALNKIKEMRGLLERKIAPPERMPEIKLPTGVAREPQRASEKPLEAVKEQPVPEPVFRPARVAVAEKPFVAETISFVDRATTPKQAGSLEQRIGTRWVLIAGVITSIVGVGFFLKYAYDNDLIGPLGRVVITAVAGIAALIVGEGTRRRGYEIAAKGTTALGFAFLYAADFAAYRFYDLIGSVPAFAVAIIITAAAMAYAVALNEVVAAFLAMLGGFVTPVLVSKGENMPVPLFGYVLVLSTGAMMCAFYRKWRAVNLLAFIGTFVLYSGWFEKFFRSQLHAAGPPEQMAIALGWLGIFFGVYLVLPLVYGLANRAIARKDDVWLVVINVSWTFFYLWTILFERHQTSLALCAAGLSAAHLAMMGVVFVRCREDEALRQTLLVIGLVFLTTAIPLYWHMNSVIIGWAIEGALLVFVGIRYRSILTQLGGAASLVLACVKLVWQLPMHTDAFRLVLNNTFAIWVFVAAMVWLCHFFYRRYSQSPDEPWNIIAQIFYTAAVLILFCAATLEWAAHCKYNLLVGYDLHYISRGQSIIFAVAVLLFAIRPMCPLGMLIESFKLIALTAGVIFAVFALPVLHTEKFLILANWDFAAIFVFILAILFCHLGYRITAKTPQSEAGILSQVLYAVVVVVLICAGTFEWAAHCKYNLLVGYDLHYITRGQSIILAAAVLLFAVRPLCPMGRLTESFTIITLATGVLFVVCALAKLHIEKFVIFANLDFAAVSIFLISILFCQIKYRLIAESPQSESGILSQALYAVFGLIFLAVITAEWYWHCGYNLGVWDFSPALIRGQIIVFAAGILGFAVRPLCPRGQLSGVCAAGLAAFGSVFTIMLYTATHKQGFLIFANPTFAAAAVLAASLFMCVYLFLRRRTDEPEGKVLAVGISVLAIILLWVVLSEEIYEYWRCRDLYTHPLPNWNFIANMWMSVTWAIYGLILLIVGFWRKLKMLRYIGLSVFGVLLLKAFIIDMSEVSTIYRILAFMATGVTLVGVSYIYQFLKKKGFFDTMPTRDLNNKISS